MQFAPEFQNDSKMIQKTKQNRSKSFELSWVFVSLFIIRQWFCPPTDEIKLPPKVGAVAEIYDYVFPMIL